MRIGILGGTFDPVHLGHLILAEQCREQASLDEVWFVPAGTPPHKQQQTISPAADRIAMLELATAGHAQFLVSDIEIKRQGTSYTVETLASLASEDDSRELFLLLGADMLEDLPNWREPERILELAQLIAVNRGRQPASIPESLQSRYPQAEARIQYAEMPAVAISATDLRERARKGRSLRYMTPRAVECYIHQKRLYS